MIDSIDSMNLTDKELRELEAKLNNINYIQQQAAEKLAQIRKTNIERLSDYQIELIEEEQKRRIAADQE
jgi:hypothetical protein